MRSSPLRVPPPMPSRPRWRESVQAARAEHPRLGLIVNPVAGLGGSVALKGSDGADTVALALRLGAIPGSSARTARTLKALASRGGSFETIAAPGSMGATLARAAGLTVTETGPGPGRPTTAGDTRSAAQRMLGAGVELLLFAGGDGTARDIYDAVGTELPILGIPAGVKMHSGVFASSPEAAAAASHRYLSAATSVRLRAADIADIDEELLRSGHWGTKLHGSALVPDIPSLVLRSKAGSIAHPGAALEALCREVAAALHPGTLYLLGPGSTTAAVIHELGAVGALLGVDAVLDGRVVGSDLTESEILELLADQDDVRLIVGLVGGQGVLFGRGNHQIGASVLRRVGRGRITILSAADKLHALDPPTLWVDTGDPELDAELAGYVKVDVAPGRQVVMKLSH